MAKRQETGELQNFDQFSELVGQLLNEENEMQWEEFCDHVQEVVDKKYEVGGENMPLNSMYWNMLGTMADPHAQVTLESIGGNNGLKEILNQAKEQSIHCEKLITDSLDQNSLFVHQKSGRDARPQERFLELTKENGSFIVLGSGGQGFVLYGKLKALPFEILEQFYSSLIQHEPEETEESSREKTAAVFKGERSLKDKAKKLHKALLDRWKDVINKAGYAFDPEKHFGRHVAVKIFPKTTLSPVDSFKKESKFVGWPNAHIMPIFGKGTSKNGISIVIMPYIDMSNAVTVARFTRFHTLDEAIDVLAKLCGALGELHLEGLIHRDIKPGNILIAQEKSLHNAKKTVLRPILTDFGLASVPEYTMYSISNTLKGTPLYLPPEQAIDSKRAKPQSDMYSLGLWAYEIITGETYNPVNEQMPALINRLWALAKGNIYHKADVPTSVHMNIVENQVNNTKFKGLFAFFKRRKYRKDLTNKMKNVEKVLARMIVTANASSVLDYYAKKTEYRTITKKKGRIEYTDLRDDAKDEFISKLISLRYKNMIDIVTDLKEIQKGESPKIPDYRKMVFRGISSRKLLKTVLILILVLGAAAAALHFTGKLPAVIDWVRNLFNSTPQ